MLKKGNKSINSKYLKKQIILVIFISIYVLSLSFISGKYVVKNVQTYLSSSKEFYFYSDKLKNEDAYKISWTGKEECTIPINLYTKLNSLKAAEYKIAYTVMCKVDERLDWNLSKTEGIIYPNNNNTDAFILSINPNSEFQIGEIFEIQISVETKDVYVGDEKLETYSKTLTRNFEITIVDESDITCKIEDEAGRAYLNLIVRASKDKPITLNFSDTELVIDNTNNIVNTSECSINENNYINEITLRESATVKFFKKDKTQQYTTATINEIFDIKGVEG